MLTNCLTLGSLTVGSLTAVLLCMLQSICLCDTHYDIESMIVIRKLFIQSNYTNHLILDFTFDQATCPFVKDLCCPLDVQSNDSHCGFHPRDSL